MQGRQTALFDTRFLESYAGHIVADHKVAVMELIANAWDAGSTEVRITWPTFQEPTFSVLDNGHGMTESQFNKRWRTLSYNRLLEQGEVAEFPLHSPYKDSKRMVFGRNGKGRLAAFAFGNEYFVKTRRQGKENTFKVFRDINSTLIFQKIGREIDNEEQGSEIYVPDSMVATISCDAIRGEIGMRFLTDPSFQVYVNNIEVTFSDIPEKHISSEEFYIEGIGLIKITCIDIKTTDRTTHQHGVAWRVLGRLVGECTWKGSGQEHIVDGRRIGAKRYTFIVEVDGLKNDILPDWTGFRQTSSNYQKVYEEVKERIKKVLLKLTEESRNETFDKIKSENYTSIKKLSLISKERWETFIHGIQEDCPSISENDLIRLGGVLANLEFSNSKFALIERLSELETDQLDDLNGVLRDWTFNAAKIVLDELKLRLNLVEELKNKMDDKNTDEVQELQPIFHSGLWIFGPEYETIEYTSNEGMTNVIQKNFGEEKKGSRNRPDFVILPDSSLGLYSYPRYDENGGEIGVEKLTIVELKKPGVPIGEEQKGQAWKYVKELSQHGLIKEYTKVVCFVLGDSIDPEEAAVRSEKDGKVRIIPMEYNLVLKRAKGRLLKLYDKVKYAPFLEKKKLEKFLHEKIR